MSLYQRDYKELSHRSERGYSLYFWFRYIFHLFYCTKVCVATQLFATLNSCLAFFMAGILAPLSLVGSRWGGRSLVISNHILCSFHLSYLSLCACELSLNISQNTLLSVELSVPQLSILSALCLRVLVCLSKALVNYVS